MVVSLLPSYLFMTEQFSLCITGGPISALPDFVLCHFSSGYLFSRFSYRVVFYLNKMRLCCTHLLVILTQWRGGSLGNIPASWRSWTCWLLWIFWVEKPSHIWWKRNHVKRNMGVCKWFDDKQLDHNAALQIIGVATNTHLLRVWRKAFRPRSRVKLSELKTVNYF